jgi:hypothetical protein
LIVSILTLCDDWLAIQGGLGLHTMLFSVGSSIWLYLLTSAMMSAMTNDEENVGKVSLLRDLVRWHQPLEHLKTLRYIIDLKDDQRFPAIIHSDIEFCKNRIKYFLA